LKKKGGFKKIIKNIFGYKDLTPIFATPNGENTPP
jgi:hypothetical protein